MFEEKAVGKLLGGAAAQGDDDVILREGAREGGGLQAAEVGLAVGGEELGHGGAGAGFEVLVEIEEGPAELAGKQASDGGFARAHETGKHDAQRGRRDGRSGFGWICGLSGGHFWLR